MLDARLHCAAQIDQIAASIKDNKSGSGAFFLVDWVKLTAAKGLEGRASGCVYRELHPYWIT
jgi:hypothetical protein